MTAPLGLGDAVAKVAEPVAKFLGLSPCKGCGQRKETLNTIANNINPLSLL